MREETDRHVYEMLPVVGNAEKFPYLSVRGLEQGAVSQAVKLLNEHPEYEKVKVYHSYPSPGPVRRFCGSVLRDGELHRPA